MGLANVGVVSGSHTVLARFACGITPLQAPGAVAVARIEVVVVGTVLE